jgi:uncharacterized protein YndB with AHSA1/START domain
MTSTTAVSTDTQVYRVYIKASAEKIWQAITDPEWTERYGYGGLVSYDLRKGGAFTTAPSEAMKAGAAEFGMPMGDVIIDGEVLEVDPPNRLVQTWRMLMDPTAAAEGFTTITYEIETVGPAFCCLTVVHDLTGAPSLAAMVRGDNTNVEQGGGGHPWILSDLKSLLETGKTLS